MSAFVQGAAQGQTQSGTLDSRARATITAAARIMYPHDALPDEIYAREDPGITTTVEDGVSGLNRARPCPGCP